MLAQRASKVGARAAFNGRRPGRVGGWGMIPGRSRAFSRYLASMKAGRSAETASKEARATIVRPAGPGRGRIGQTPLSHASEAGDLSNRERSARSPPSLKRAKSATDLTASKASCHLSQASEASDRLNRERSRTHASAAGGPSSHTLAKRATLALSREWRSGLRRTPHSVALLPGPFPGPLYAPGPRFACRILSTGKTDGKLNRPPSGCLDMSEAGDKP